MIYYLMELISGKSCRFLTLNCLLRSLPANPVLKLPKITPSGLIMGTILKIHLSLKYVAYLEVIKLRNPFITWLPLDYPGCIRAVANITFLCLCWSLLMFYYYFLFIEFIWLWGNILLYDCCYWFSSVMLWLCYLW